MLCMVSLAACILSVSSLVSGLSGVHSRHMMMRTQPRLQLAYLSGRSADGCNRPTSMGLTSPMLWNCQGCTPHGTARSVPPCLGGGSQHQTRMAGPTMHQASQVLRRPHLLDGLLGSFQVQVGDADRPREAGRKGGLVGCLVGQGQGAHGAPVEARGEGHDLVRRLCLRVVRVDARCSQHDMWGACGGATCSAQTAGCMLGRLHGTLATCCHCWGCAGTPHWQQV